MRFVAEKSLSLINVAQIIIPGINQSTQKIINYSIRTLHK